jgi:peptidoglycan/LPS O-acetylase OafA/YrhL
MSVDSYRLASSAMTLNVPARSRTFSVLKIGTEKYPALTGVRAFGAIAVFFDHFPLWPRFHITLNVMAFFFALSGFLIVRIYYEQAELRPKWLATYFVNRFARIYPVYFLILSIAILLNHNYGFWELLTNYTLTHGLFRQMPLIIQPSWSLTTEECFYLLAPMLMLLARVYNFLVPFILSCLLLCGALFVSTLGIGFLETPEFVLVNTFFGNVVEFFAGVYIALAVMRLEKKGSIHLPGNRYTVAGLAGVSVMAAAMIIVYRGVPLNFSAIILINNFLIPFPIALLYWGLIREDTLLSRLLSGRAVGLLARGSYCFYLLHTLIIDHVSLPLFASWGGYRPLYVVVTFIVAWIVSILMFLLYEEPVNLFIRRKFRSKAFQKAKT